MTLADIKTLCLLVAAGYLLFGLGLRFYFNENRKLRKRVMWLWEFGAIALVIAAVMTWPQYFHLRCLTGGCA